MEVIFSARIRNGSPWSFLGIWQEAVKIGIKEQKINDTILERKILLNKQSDLMPESKQDHS